jgi:hypothetical protein
MRNQTPIDGPDFLDQYADRLDANGLTLEADQIRGVKRQWDAERSENQTAANHATFLEHQLNNARKALQATPSTH